MLIESRSNTSLCISEARFSLILEISRAFSPSSGLISDLATSKSIL